MATTAAQRTKRAATASSSGDNGKLDNAKPRSAGSVRAGKGRSAATPWGAAAILEEASVQQRAGGKRFAVVVQLLEAGNGERLIRFAYTTSGSARRGPVTMRARDLERLRAALQGAPALNEVLGL